VDSERERSVMQDYKELIVWQKSIELVKSIYTLCKVLPKEETYSLSDQIRRCVVSIPSNIAKRSGRNTTKEFIQFLYISLGSACELETQLIIGKEIGYFSDVSNYLYSVNEIKKMINGLINSLKNKDRNAN